MGDLGCFSQGLNDCGTVVFILFILVLMYVGLVHGPEYLVGKIFKTVMMHFYSMSEVNNLTSTFEGKLE